VDKYLGLATASRKEEVKSEIQQAIRDFQRFEGDTGSSEVQVALLTTKIAALADHLKIHAKDHSSRRGLRAMLNQRRKLLQYLRRTKFDNYAKLIARIGLKDSFGPQDRFSQRYKIK
jgi:small subunit ribosomal protein S15